MLDTSGSFLAGVDGAQPGVFMPAPRIRPEVQAGVVPGRGRGRLLGVGLNRPVTVPYGSFRHALRTAETTALEPGVVDEKYYVLGIGEVSERAVRGGAEGLVLVDVLS